MIIGEYSPIITEPEANNCSSINTQVIISKKRKKKKIQREIIFTYSGKTTTGSHFVRRGDYRLIIERANESARFYIITCLFILTRINSVMETYETPIIAEYVAVIIMT